MRRASSPPFLRPQLVPALGGAVIALLLPLAPPAHAKLGETLDQLVARFGTDYRREDGVVLHFRSPGWVAVDAVLSGPNGRCIEETYLSRKSLDAKTGEPPADVVQAILKANAPASTRWKETSYAAADYALRSEDGSLLAALRYRRPPSLGGEEQEATAWEFRPRGAAVRGRAMKAELRREFGF